MVQQHKTCTTCGETKTLDGFHKQKLGKYGVRSRCKTCIVESSRRYREANQDEIAERKRSYREENRDEIAERRRSYQEENRDVNNARAAKHLREEQKLTKMFATTPLYARYLPGEDALILADNGMTMYQKAIELCRTYASVQSRRRRLLAKGGVSNDRANA